jgi:Contractile injection system tube protein
MTTNANARSPRCSLVNLITGEEMKVLFNPTELQEKVSVNYNRVQILGLSHQLLQFQSTGNRTFPLEFYLDRFFAESQPGAPEILDFRAFIRALTVPPAGTKGVTATAPPRVLIVWPGVMSVESVVTDAEFSFKQFSGKDGKVLVYSAKVSFEEILDVRVTSEDLRGDV